MKKIYLLSLIPLYAICFISTSCSSKKARADEPEQEASLTNKELIARGEHLVQIMGCNDCHSPKKMGPKSPEVIPELLLSGFPADRPIVQLDKSIIEKGFAIAYPDMTAMAGPWGMSFAGNLTPDKTGIGNWTEAQFKKAITEGKYKGLDASRMLLPPMPWINYTKLTDEEVHAVFTYLKSLKPVKNIVPAPIPPQNL